MNALNTVKDLIGQLTGIIVALIALGVAAGVVFGGGLPSVSYTHLTLPTKRIV